MTRTTMITPAVNIRRSSGGLASPAPAAWRSAISSGGSSRTSRARVTSEPYTSTSWGILKDDPQSPGPAPSDLERQGMPWSRSRCSASRAKGSFSNVVNRTCLRRFFPEDKNRSSLNNANGGAATRSNPQSAGKQPPDGGRPTGLDYNKRPQPLSKVARPFNCPPSFSPQGESRALSPI